MNQHYAVRNTSVTSYSLDNLQLVGHLQTRIRHGVSSFTALLSSRYHQHIHVLTSIRVLIVLSHYHQGTHCVILSSGYQGTHCVILLSGYLLCYDPIIRVLMELASPYHQGYSLCYPIFNVPGYSLCYSIIRVLIVL